MGCKPEVEVYAPERDTHIVWGVLDAQKDSQYVKITRTYQSETDPLANADTEDYSLANLNVVLEGNNKTYIAEMEEIQRDSGLFVQNHTLYRFDTQGADRLQGGKRYSLRITKPDDPDLLITAWTDIPTTPELIQPAEPQYSPDRDSYTLPMIDLDDDFAVRARNNSGEGYEARIYADYEQNGETKTVRWGPLPIAREPRGCEANVDRGYMCINIPGQAVGNTFYRDIDYGLGPIAHYDSMRSAHTLHELSDVARVEFTAVDYHLTRFMYANNSFGYGLNLLMDKRELSNVEGADAGIFGSINHTTRKVILDGCTKFKAGFIPVSPSNCE